MHTQKTYITDLENNKMESIIIRHKKFTDFFTNIKHVCPLTKYKNPYLDYENLDGPVLEFLCNYLKYNYQIFGIDINMVNVVLEELGSKERVNDVVITECEGDGCDHQLESTNTYSINENDIEDEGKTVIDIDINRPNNDFELIELNDDEYTEDGINNQNIVQPLPPPETLIVNNNDLGLDNKIEEEIMNQVNQVNEQETTHIENEPVSTTEKPLVINPQQNLSPKSHITQKDEKPSIINSKQNIPPKSQITQKDEKKRKISESNSKSDRKRIVLNEPKKDHNNKTNFMKNDMLPPHRDSKHRITTSETYQSETEDDNEFDKEIDIFINSIRMITSTKDPRSLKLTKIILFCNQNNIKINTDLLTKCYEKKNGQREYVISDTLLTQIYSEIVNYEKTTKRMISSASNQYLLYLIEYGLSFLDANFVGLTNDLIEDHEIVETSMAVVTTIENKFGISWTVFKILLRIGMFYQKQRKLKLNPK